MSAQPINGKKLIHGNQCQVLANAFVDLISRAQRPYLFKVTVMGLPPHIATRYYDIKAKSDNDAAMKGISLFVDEMSKPLALILAHPT